MQKQEANATPAAIPFAAAFIEEAAALAGMSASDFILTIGIMTAASTGFCILDAEAEYAADDTLGTLEKLVSTAEWPEWSELDSGTQQDWGNEYKYKAAQFNTLLDCVGLGQARDDYYEYHQNGGTGGGDFDEGEQSILQRIGGIGNKWASGLRVPVEDITAIFDKDAADSVFSINGFGGYQELISRDIGSLNIPSGAFPAYVSFQSMYTYGGGGNNPYIYYNVIDGSNVYGLVYSNTNKRSAVYFSESPFTATKYNYRKTTGEISSISTYPSKEATINGLTFNYSLWVSSASYNDYQVNTNYYSNAYIGSLTESQAQNIAYLALTGALPGRMIGYDAESYPDNAVGADKLGPDSKWDDLFGKLESLLERADTPFNPNNQSGSEKFDQQAQSVFIPLIQLPFDKMFPFCVIWDIGKLMDKMYELGGFGSVSADQSTSLRSVYAQRDGLQVQGDRGDVDLSIPGKPEWTQGHTEIVADLSQFGIPGTEGVTLMVDVWPLAVLLSYIRPFLQMLFIAGLLYVTILTFRMFIFNG